MRLTARQRWTHAGVALLGLLPFAVVVLHAYSHSPPAHPQPSHAQAVAALVLGLPLVVLVGWTLRARLAGHWLRVAGTSLGAPLAVIVSGIVRTRAEADGEVTQLVVAGLLAGGAYVLVLLLLAIAPSREVVMLVVPLVVALAVGHGAFWLPGSTRAEIARRVGYPYPTQAVTELLYGHPLES